MLARPPDLISLLDPIIALEGPIEPVACIQEDVLNGCSVMETCPVRETWERVTEAVRQILEATTFEELIEKEQENIAAAERE